MIGMVQRSASTCGPNEWMLDTGSTTHVCFDRSQFKTEKRSRSSFKVWTGEVARGVMSGEVLVRARNKRKGSLVELQLKNVEYSPHGSTNLLSLGAMEANGWVMSTNAPEDEVRKVFLDRQGERVELFRRGAHYWLQTEDGNVVDGVSMMSINADASPLMRWHERLGHLNIAAIKHMVENGTVRGLDIPPELFKKKFVCLSCMSAKQKRRSYKASAAEKRTKVNYERLMPDTCDMGKYMRGIGDVRYFQLVQDEGSRYKWCFPLKKKSDANGNTMKLMAELLAQGHQIKTFSSDGGSEFDNNELKKFLTARGIRFVPTHPYTPEENALVEKLNGVLVNKVRAAMHAANMPTQLCSEVLQYVVDIDNMSATRALNGKTPSEKLLGTKPDVAKIRVWGSVGFIHQTKRKNKLSPKAEPALLLGFATISPGYRLLHLRAGKIVEARDVRFREDITASKHYVCALLQKKQTNSLQIPFVPLPVEYVASGGVRASAAQVVRADLPRDAELTASNSSDLGGAAPSSRESETDDELLEDAVAQVDDANPVTVHAATPQSQTGARNRGQRQTRRQRQRIAGQQDNGQPVRRSTRTRRTNVRLGDYVLSLEETFICNPTSVDEAMRSPQREEWITAMKAEYESLIKNGTWKLVDRPKSSKGKPVKVLTTKWVYCVKRDEKGNIVRYKARLVIHGFKQRFGHEYWDTYSPVVRIVTMILVLLLAFLLALEARHVDVETAFLNSWLRGVTIYMEQPAYFDDGTGRVCWLQKGIYGLKQAARIWYQTLHAYLVELGFRRCAHDVGLYVKYVDGRVVLVTVYVDDMMIVGKPNDIDDVIAALRLKFIMKDMGRVRHLLSMEIHYEPGVLLCLSQTAYIDQVLERFHMSMARSVGSPQMHNERMTPLERDSTKTNDPSIPYREIVGKLQYLVTCTRPDIASAVRSLGRHAGAYTSENFASAKRVLQYLRGTRTFGLVYRKSEAEPVEQLQLRAFSDSDHANCPDTGRSVTGYVLQLNGLSFGFKSKKQKSVTDDTCKSELVAASTCVEDLLWAQELLREIGMKPLVPELHCDNQSTIKVCEHVGNYDGVKRLAKMSHKIAELVEKKELSLNYVPTADNVADLFTKALGPQRFTMLRGLLGVKDVVEAVAMAGLPTDLVGDQGA